jgi:hypothetical protein
MTIHAAQTARKRTLGGSFDLALLDDLISAVEQRFWNLES